MARKEESKETEQEAEKKSVNRREFLNFAWLASLGFLTLNIAGVTFLFALPRFKEGEFGGRIRISKISELPEAGTPPVNYPKVKLWLSNTDEGVSALYKVCTHLCCLYNWRDLEDKFVCPCHGSQFHDTGQYIQGPAPRSLDQFVVQIVDPTSGAVLVESSDTTPLPLPDNPDAEVWVDTGRRIQGPAHA
jgi:cytochrome b6-f complex iron-sulfur subunit